MNDRTSYFFCGIGGSGMLPLALILNGRGACVKGSDRALDQGHTPNKFEYLKSLGIELYPQDGSGITSSDQVLVASAAIEETVPDVVSANAHGCRRLSRAELLSNLFNASDESVGVAGTSGKSTTTGMIGWILSNNGRDPTVMNGAVMKNFVSENALFASALIGGGTTFVSEVDESDGSIACYHPTIAVLNNISHDHKSMSELRTLFGDFVTRSTVAILNMDDHETSLLSDRANAMMTYGLDRQDVTITALEIEEAPTSVSFSVRDNQTGQSAYADLQTPGRHNVSNALAAICTGRALGLDLDEITNSLSKFSGIKRRFEVVGTVNGMTVIDDFAHNPDKISATLRTLHAFDGRLIVVFQPHGFGPLRTLRGELVETFRSHLKHDDMLIMLEPVYYGGTVDRSVSSSDLVSDLQDFGVQATLSQTREQCREIIKKTAETGDRITVMGARDDTLSKFAQSLLDDLASV